jgi:hypothetical protein
VLKLAKFIKNFCDIAFTVKHMNYPRVLAYKVFNSGDCFHPFVCSSRILFFQRVGFGLLYELALAVVSSVLGFHLGVVLALAPDSKVFAITNPLIDHSQVL